MAQVPVVAYALPQAVIITNNSDGSTNIRVVQDPLAPPEDRQSFERYIQRTGEYEEERRSARSRARESRGGSRSRYVSMSPPADREVEVALANDRSDRTIIGAPRSVWNQLISDFRRSALEDIDVTPPHLVLENLMRRFTRLALDNEPPNDFANDSDDDEVPANYVECVFVKRTKTYHKVTVGANGGKFFYDHNGQKKYIKAVGGQVEFVNPNQVPVVDNNPALNTTTLTL